MSLKDPTSIRPTLGTTLGLRTLASQTLAGPSLPRANLLRALRASNQRVLLVQNQSPSERRTASEPAKVNPRTQYYKCQGYGHLASQCPSQTKILLVKFSIEDVEEEGDVEVAVH